MKAKSVKEIEKMLGPISDMETIEVNLKQLLLVYWAIEDWRGFFHNPMHYPTVEDVSKYLGNKRSGMYAVMNHECRRIVLASVRLSISCLFEGKSIFNAAQSP